MLADPAQFASTAGLDLIAVTQLVVYAVVLLACALRPEDASTNAVSVAVLVLGAMVLVPGRFGLQVNIGVLTLAGFTAVSVLRYDDPALPLLPLVANLGVAVLWGAAILRITNRDARRRWAAVRAGDRANADLERELAESDRLRAELQTLAREDPLTSAANRRELLRAADELLGERRRGGRVSLLLLDADGFKSINDRFGHAVGDTALVSLVEGARSAVRSEDLVARVGGEEFAVLLPDLDGEAAVRTRAGPTCRGGGSTGGTRGPHAHCLDRCRVGRARRHRRAPARTRRRGDVPSEADRRQRRRTGERRVRPHHRTSALTRVPRTPGNPETSRPCAPQAFVAQRPRKSEPVPTHSFRRGPSALLPQPCPGGHGASQHG
jgi:GGDEF domain-containing protein